MKELVKSENITLGNEFGNGPSWRMRLIRTVGDILGFQSDLLLKHSFRRGIYYIPLAINCRRVLLGKDKVPRYYDWPMKDLVDYWKDIWLKMRKANKR